MQLQKFKSGVRGGANDTATAKQMAPMAMTLADDAAMNNAEDLKSLVDVPVISVGKDERLNAKSNLVKYILKNI